MKNEKLYYCFNSLIALTGLIVLSPLLLSIVFVLRIQYGAPVMFIQTRIGKKGIPFKIYKFRTMFDGNDSDSISVEGQDRITPLGKFLRKYKLDELPELVNVFLGDMNFVGPRPDVPGYADELTGADRAILSIRPGITGPASLKYRNEESLLAKVKNPKHYNDQVIYPDKLRINREYVLRRSITMDLRIIFATVLGYDLNLPWIQNAGKNNAD